jgi:hypothetical protein
MGQNWPQGDPAMKEQIKTELSADGLRYVSKTGGSDFPGSFGATMSCFRCGRHMARSRLRSFLLAGTRQFCCMGGCAPRA